MTTLFLATALALSCGKDDVLPDVYPDFSIVDGDTVKTRIDRDIQKARALDTKSPRYFVIGDTVVTYREVKLHTPPLKAPDLKNIKNEENPALKGKPLRYVAVGGSLTAGVREGGYFNEGIQTSYPALVARQMRLEKFEQPLFNAADYNGYGRKVLSGYNYTGGPLPKYKEAKNNSGIDHLTPKGAIFKGFTGNADNYGVMNFYTSANTILYPMKDLPSLTPYKDFFKRFIKDPSVSLSKQLQSENFDLISFETGWQETWDRFVNKSPQFAGTSVYPDGINDLNYQNVAVNGEGIPVMHGKMTFMKELKESGKAKFGYFLNLPLMTQLPYFNLVTREKLNATIAIYNKSTIFKENIMVIPTTEVDSLMGNNVHPSMKKGVSFEKPLSKYSILSDIEQRGIKDYIEGLNKETESLSKSFNFPVVDIHTLYDRILKGDYITDDGVKVDGSYPKGNFFSSDAIYPTAFGQSVIANEVIKALNHHYKINIPLINTREYLSK